jgi:hypothetical protein
MPRFATNKTPLKCLILRFPVSNFRLTSPTVELLLAYNSIVPGNTKDIPTLLSLQATLELRENLLCICTGSENMDVFVKKMDKESETFLKSTLNQPRNAAIFKIVQKAISASETWETDPHVSAVLNSAIFHALNLKVARRNGR